MINVAIDNMCKYSNGFLSCVKTFLFKYNNVNSWILPFYDWVHGKVSLTDIYIV